MACGCRKRKTALGSNGEPTTRQQVNRVIKPSQRLAPPQGSFYSRLVYYVFPDDSTWDGPTAEQYGTLAEARSRMRQLGPGYLVEAQR